MQLPLVNTQDQALSQLSTKWKAILDPVLANTLVQGQQIDGITLTSGQPQAVYHSLGQIPQGWIVVDTNASANIWRSQPFNAKTITLEASNNTTISIWIY